MHRIARFSLLAAVSFATVIQAQSVISVHSGTIHYVEGKVLLNDQAISPKFGEFPAMDNGSVLRTTAEGRVEVLLVPGVILHVGESSSIRMVSNALDDTRVELQTGKAVLECDGTMKGDPSLKDDAVSMLVGGRALAFVKDGIYEMSAQPPAAQVYKGEMTVVLPDGKPMIVKKGHEALLGNQIGVEKFDEDATDELYNWSSRRDGYLALANVSAAQAAGNSYTGGGGWTFNPWFDMFTMVPGAGMLWSPFGWGYYSPYAALGMFGYGGFYPYGYGYGYYGGYYPGYYGGTYGGTSYGYGGRPVSQSGSGGGRSGVSIGRLGGATSGFNGGYSGGGYSGGASGGSAVYSGGGGRSASGGGGGGGFAGAGGGGRGGH